MHAAIDRLVEDGRRRHGRFAARPPVVDPLDEFVGVGRALRRWRLKEWVGFLLVHPDWAFSFIMQDAKYLASSELFAYDRRADALHKHEAIRPPGALRLPADLLDGRCRFHHKGYDLEYAFGGDGGRHRLRVAMAATGGSPAVEGELELDGSAASAPLSVSSRLPGGSLYTYKAVFAVEGVLRVGDDEVAFDGGRDLAIVDEHRSLLPYRTDWTWGTFALRTDDGLVGANFATRPLPTGEEEESGLWVPGACERLADVSFEPTSDDPLAPWHIASADGRLDVTFEPSRRNAVRHQLGVFAMDYVNLYGAYTGVVRGADRSYDVAGVHGVCERMHARL